MTTPSSMPAAGPNAAQDTRFFYIVSVLLLMIIILLGTLWVVMRNRAMQAESQLNALRQQLAIQQALGGGGGMAQALARLGAGGLPDQAMPGGTSTEPAVMQAKRLIHMPAVAAAVLGYRPGDVIIVDPPGEATGNREQATNRLPAAGSRAHSSEPASGPASAPQR